MNIKRRNNGKPITKIVVEEVRKLYQQKFTAEQIGIKTGRSAVAIYNIFRLYNITGNKKRK